MTGTKGTAETGGTKGGGRRAGLYVHVPFCVRKCAYCAFFSRAGAGEELREAWLRGLEKDRRAWRERGVPEGWGPGTVYVGGGTPSALPLRDWERLLAFLHGTFDLSGVEEWTVEANPGAFSGELARLLRAGGVDRISLGAQSFDAGRLKALGRIHGPGDVRAAVETARAEGFGRVSLDLIYGLPGTGAAEALADARAAMKLGPEHVSCYALEVEPGTPLAARGTAVDGGAQREAYEALRETLGAGGYGQYELSNWARAGEESRHNGLYWCGGEYLGLGPAAHSHWRGTRRGNTAELPVWGEEFEETLDPEAKARETLVFGLRRTAGWTRREFAEATGGFDWTALRGAEIARCVAEGTLVESAERLRLAEGAYFVSDGVFSELV